VLAVCPRDRLGCSQPSVAFLHSPSGLTRFHMCAGFVTRLMNLCCLVFSFVFERASVPAPVASATVLLFCRQQPYPAVVWWSGGCSQGLDQRLTGFLVELFLLCCRELGVFQHY